MFGDKHVYLKGDANIVYISNPSLGGTTGNITPHISLTLPILEQHRIHLNMTFHFKFYIKKLPKLCKI